MFKHYIIAFFLILGFILFMQEEASKLKEQFSKSEENFKVEINQLKEQFSESEENSKVKISQLKEQFSESEENSKVKISQLKEQFSESEENSKVEISKLKHRLEDKRIVEKNLHQQISDQQELLIINSEIMLNNFNLGLQSDSEEYFISKKSLQTLLLKFYGFEVELISIVPDLRRSLSGVNLSRVSKINIIEEVDQFILRHVDYEIKSHSVDFLLKIKYESDSSLVINESIKLRIHFSENFSNLQYKILYALGRNGLNMGNFSLPYGTEIYDDRLWTTDCSNETISVYEKDGRFVDSFSHYGHELGELDTPADIKINNGVIYVVEERNHRIQLFNESGQFISTFGTYGNMNSTPEKEPFSLNNPLGIAMSENIVLVVDYGNNRVVGFKRDDKIKEAAWISHIVSEGVNWKAPYYAEFLPKRNQFVVVNRGGNEIVLLSNDGEFIKNFGSHILDYPHEVAFDSNENIYIADMHNHQVVKFLNNSDYEAYEIIKFPTTYGFPKTIAIDKNDNMFVGFTGNGTAYFLHIVNLNDATKNKVTNYLKMKINTPKKIFNLPIKQFVSVSSNAEENYKSFCAVCHEGGRYGAPSRGNIESWSKFNNFSLDTLVDLTIEGNGAMIPKGGCDKCSESDLEEIIKFMLPMTWEYK